MKKKNVLMMALSLCMVAVIAVGGTLAYLTASDGALTNTFTFADNIKVDLFETINDKTEQSGHNYTNLVAGQTVAKNVDVTLESSFDTWLLIKVYQDSDVEGARDMVLTDTLQEILGNGWQLVDGQTNVYYLDVDADAADKTFDVFENVKTPDVTLSGNGTVTLKNVVIDVFAVQKEGLATAKDAFGESQWAA